MFSAIATAAALDLIHTHNERAQRLAIEYNMLLQMQYGKYIGQKQKTTCSYCKTHSEISTNCPNCGAPR